MAGQQRRREARSDLRMAATLLQAGEAVAAVGGEAGVAGHRGGEGRSRLSRAVESLEQMTAQVVEPEALRSFRIGDAGALDGSQCRRRSGQ